MSACRTCFLVGALTAIALVVVHLRTEQTRSAARILSIESEWTQLRSEWWALQSRATRLRAPKQLRQKLDTLQTVLIAPEDERAQLSPIELTAARLPE